VWQVVAENAVQHCTTPVTERGEFRALGIDAAIQLHQKLDCLHALIIRVEVAAVMNILVSEVFNCMAQDLKSMANLGSDGTANNPLRHGNLWQLSLCRGRGLKVCAVGGVRGLLHNHVFILSLIIGVVEFYCEITGVLSLIGNWTECSLLNQEDFSSH
jgi:hypothetical protein